MYMDVALCVALKKSYFHYMYLGVFWEKQCEYLNYHGVDFILQGLPYPIIIAGYGHPYFLCPKKNVIIALVRGVFYLVCID